MNAVVCETSSCKPPQPGSEVGDLGRYASTALNVEGLRVVATYDTTYRNLVLITERPDGTRRSEILDGAKVENNALVDTDSGRYPAVAVEGDKVHVVWHDVDAGELRYTVKAPGQVREIVRVDGQGSAIRGTHTSIAVGDDGVVHVAYRDETSRNLRYARRDLEGQWTHAAIDGCTATEDCPHESGEDYGEYTSIGLVAGAPRIAFYDRLRGDLKLALQDATGAWQVSTLDGRDPVTGLDTGDVGRFASLAVDPKRRLAVAYYDATAGALRYLVAAKGNPEPITVDDGVLWDSDAQAMRTHLVGQHVKLRFDPSGRAVMVYLDASRRVMRVAAAGVGGHIEIGDLDLPAAGHVGFDFGPDGTLKGACGVWLIQDLPRTELRFFTWQEVKP